jgi:tetratricopeptide (TPR) repeat protein
MQTAEPAEAAEEDETERFIAQALTDVDLFSSYGLTQKAIDLLEAVLERAPEHTATIERLLDFHLGAGNELRTAELASRLQQIHSQQGDSAAADRFAELHRRFQRAASHTSEAAAASAAPVPVPEFSVPVAESPLDLIAETAPESTAAPQVPVVAQDIPAESTIHEVDLSEEWAALAGQLSDLDPPMEPAQPAAPEPFPGFTEEDILAPPSSQPEAEEILEEIPTETAEIPSNIVMPDQPAAPEFTLELESAPAIEAAAPAVNVDDFLKELSSELDAALPSLAAMETPQPAKRERRNEADTTKAVPPQRQPAAPASTGPLSEVFEEFRAEFGEIGADDEDLETHYNLGIAYREMGLLEEAISEFQKVAKNSPNGQTFRYAMQCCTLLGLAFMEKGQPSIAAMWYERALQTPGLDQESILALRYDLGVAQELAGDMAAARKSFSQVYGMNIDYRDVAERLASLGNG